MTSTQPIVYIGDKEKGNHIFLGARFLLIHTKEGSNEK